MRLVTLPFFLKTLVYVYLRNRLKFLHGDFHVLYDNNNDDDDDNNKKSVEFYISLDRTGLKLHSYQS